MAKKKTSPAEDLFDMVSMMPWWVGVGLAIAAYVFLHIIATSAATASVPGQTDQLGRIAVQAMFKGLATFGQYLLPIIFLGAAAVSAFRRRKRRQLLSDVAQSTSASVLDGMSWQEFELLVGEAFRQKGFAVAESGGGADGGVDLVLEKNGEKFLVQCKQWRAFKVGVEIVRELYGVMAARGAAGGYVVTSGQFTQEAKEFASGRNISLMDSVALRDLIGGVKARPVSGGAQAVRGNSSQTAQGSEAVLACPICGSSMVRRTAKRGANAGKTFWGCSKYPGCKGIRNT